MNLSKFPKELFASRLVCLMRGFRCIETAERYPFSSDHDGSPISSAFCDVDAFETRRIGSWYSGVHYLLGMCGLSQIVPGVVGAVTIYVIDRLQRPFASNIYPDQSMGQECAAVQPNGLISLLHMASDVPGVFDIPSFEYHFGSEVAPGPRAPSHGSSLGIIVKKLADVVSIRHWAGSHKFSPYKRLWLGALSRSNEIMLRFTGLSPVYSILCLGRYEN